MNKKIVIAIVILLVLAGGAYAYSRRTTQVSKAPADQNTLSKVSEAAQFAAAMQSGQPTTCVLAKDGNTMTYRLKSKMMRAEFAVPTPNASVGTTTSGMSHMINDTQYIYMWADGQKQGTKFAVTTASSAAPNAPTTRDSAPKAPSLSDESDYNSLKDSGYTINCQAGSVNDSDFVPPTDVTFLDTAAMMKAVPSPAANGQIDYKQLQQQYGKMIPQQ